MTIKLIGAVFVFLSCGGFGFMIAQTVRKETMCLRQFIIALEFMECELNYRLTPLPQLCRLTSAIIVGPVQRFFRYLAEELEKQTESSADLCISAAMNRCPDIPVCLRQSIKGMGQCLGTFDLEGQMKCICAIKEESTRIFKNIDQNQTTRLRSYKTLALCAGAALVILFI